MKLDKDNFQDISEVSALSAHEIKKLRTEMTILFSDIKGSTAFAEKKGDVEYMAMIDRHNRLLFPVIEAEGGQVVKTIGDAILARFDDPGAGVKAAAGMQRALAKDRDGRDEIDQIRIRIGLHHGSGLIKDNDVFGDVVNAASRIEHQSEADQILITDVLLNAARAAGFECAKMGRANLKGKDEPIDLYAVAWSEAATSKLIEDIQARYEKIIKDVKKEHDKLEGEFDKARSQWRAERRALNVDIEKLEDAIKGAKDAARLELSESLQSELRFQIEELGRSRNQLELDLASTRQRFEAERNNLKAQIAAIESSLVDAMERSNNPARVMMAIREQVEERLGDLKEEWQLQWEGERRRLLAEIERLKKMPYVANDTKEAARRAVLEKLGKLPPGSAAPAGKSADQWEREFQDAKIGWQTDREQLNLKIKKLEVERQHAEETIRQEILTQLRSQYDAQLNESSRERQRLEMDIQSVTSELASERQRLTARIAGLEDALPKAQQAAREQVSAEFDSELEQKLEETLRSKSRAQRHHDEMVEEWEAERRRLAKQTAALEEQLKEAKETAYKAQKISGRANPPE